MIHVFAEHRRIAVFLEEVFSLNDVNSDLSYLRQLLRIVLDIQLILPRGFNELSVIYLYKVFGNGYHKTKT
jgi:hypothetical protein